MSETTNIKCSTDGSYITIEFKENKVIAVRWKNSSTYIHRDNGPAVEHSNGRRAWFKDGLRHREDGPAVIDENYKEEYWLNGVELTKSVFNQRIKIV